MKAFEVVKHQSVRFFKKLTTREGLFGDYDYKYLFVPPIPFISKEQKTQPFFGVYADMPIFLGFILGFQHALSMLAGVVTPPIIISGSANFSPQIEQYLVSASLIVSGLLSMFQITRIKLFKGYYCGTGLLTMIGTSFASIGVVTKAFPMMYANGDCPTAADGTKLPCPDGYGRLLASAVICSILEIALSFTPSHILQSIFPNIVTGPVVLLIGTHLVESGMTDWLGGSCHGDDFDGCHVGKYNDPWGSARYVGLGFLVYLTIILSERFGSPIMKSCAVIVGLIMGCIVGGACGYFDGSNIKLAPAATFVWVHTFKLRLYGPAVLPFLAVRIVLMMEAIGDITATSDVSRQPTEGKLYESRIQGGLLADGINGIISGLATITPTSTFAQNNGVISVTKCANRTVGYWCAGFMLIMGIFAKFAAAITSIPKPVLGGMTSFLFCSVAIAGIKIISSTEFTRRDRFLLTAAVLPGMGAILLPDWFEYVFTYDGDNSSLKGFFNAIVLVMETGFAITGFIGVILNQVLPEVKDDTEEINEVVLETVGSAGAEGRSIYASKEQEKMQSFQQGHTSVEYVGTDKSLE
ncbi:hypothetical protein DICA3_F31010 [Diutina catenulata]